MVDYNVAIQQLIEAQVETHASATAVVCGDESLTYAQLNQLANQLAHQLRAEGAGPGAIVALMVERSLAMIVGILGIVKAGAAYLPLPPDHPAERTRFMLEDGGVKILLVHDKTAARFEGQFPFLGLTLNLDDPWIYAEQRQNPVLLNKPDDLVYVIYTSGSTGKPKGVMIEQRALVNRLHWMQSAYPIGPGDVILQKTPYSFDVSVWELFWWALEGATLAFLAPGGERNPAAIVKAVRRHQVSVMHFVPSMLNVFLEYLDAKGPGAVACLSSLKQVFASGEALTPSHVRKFNAILDARLTNLYGPTEATVDVTYYDCPRGRDIDLIPIGRPIDNIRLYVIRDGREAAIGETGELCIAGVGLARGYVNNPALTAERFTDNPVNPGERIYRTGDVARWLPDGNLEYLGREDQQVKIRGLRVELGEIESTVREYPGVVDCVAAIEKHSESVIILAAYVVSRSDLAAPALKEYLRKRLPEYMVPHRFERLAELPLTSSGKADRKALAR
ncbi:MAG TPA: amino acid adenylation domain-containing protein [Burkholderiales bacterium]|nr:amino acid adenylation domain-containing protein [Burkholderiales bacterium]